MPDINEKYVIYYAVRGYRTGQTVTIDVYDTAGTKEVNSQSMTEMGSTGIYYYNFRPRKRTSYVAVTDCSEFPRQAHQVIRVEKQKLGGAVKIHHVKIPDPIFKEKDKSKIFSLLKALPSKFPKPQKLEVKKEVFPDIEKLFVEARKEIVSKIPKPQKVPTEIFKDLLKSYSNSLDARFEPIAKELNKLIILSDEININQKLNVPQEKKISPEEDTMQLLMKYGTAGNGPS